MRVLLWLGVFGCVGGPKKGEGADDWGAGVTNDSGGIDDSGHAEDDCPAEEVTGGLAIFVLNIDVRGQGDDYETPEAPGPGPVDDGIAARPQAPGDEDLAYRYTPSGVEDDVLRIEFGVDLPEGTELTPEEVLNRRSWVLTDCDQESVSYGVIGTTHLIHVSDGDPVTVVVEGCEGRCYLGFGVESPGDLD